MQAFARELCIWARFDHENVLPLIGIAVIDGIPVLASEWMENGTMNEYLKEQESVDILAMVRTTLSIQKPFHLTSALKFKELHAGLSTFTTLGVLPCG